MNENVKKVSLNLVPSNQLVKQILLPLTHLKTNQNINLDQILRLKLANCTLMPSLALICIKTGVSDRITAVISSLVLIRPNDKYKVLDHSKICRGRSKFRKNVIQVEMWMIYQSAFFTAGRTKHWFKYNKKDNKHSKDVIVKEHITKLNETNLSFTEHTTSSCGSSDISNALLIV